MPTNTHQNKRIKLTTVVVVVILSAMVRSTSVNGRTTLLRWTRNDEMDDEQVGYMPSRAGPQKMNGQGWYDKMNNHCPMGSCCGVGCDNDGDCSGFCNYCRHGSCTENDEMDDEQVVGQWLSVPYSPRIKCEGRCHRSYLHCLKMAGSPQFSRDDWYQRNARNCQAEKSSCVSRKC